jgi:hypothetical protein
VLDGGKAREPARRDQGIGLVLRDQRLAVLVGPGEAVDLALSPGFQQLADRGVVADQRLVSHQGRDESQRFGLLARQAGGVLGRPLRHQRAVCTPPPTTIAILRCMRRKPAPSLSRIETRDLVIVALVRRPYLTGVVR